jgi:hypothetical protein
MSKSKKSRSTTSNQRPGQNFTLYDDNVKEIMDRIKNGTYVINDRIYIEGNDQNHYFYTIGKNKDNKLDLLGPTYVQSEIDDIQLSFHHPNAQNLDKPFENKINKQKRSRSRGGKSRKSRHSKKINKISRKHQK